MIAVSDALKRRLRGAISARRLAVNLYPGELDPTWTGFVLLPSDVHEDAIMPLIKEDGPLIPVDDEQMFVIRHIDDSIVVAIWRRTE